MKNDDNNNDEKYYDDDDKINFYHLPSKQGVDDDSNMDGW